MDVLLTGSDARVLREVEDRLRSHGCRVVRERRAGHDLAVRVEAGPWASLEPQRSDGTPTLLITDRDEPDSLAALAVSGHLDFLHWPRDEAWLGARLAVLRARLAEADGLRRGFAEALREGEEKYRLLFDNQFVAISVFDLDSGHFLDVNDVWLRLYGYERAEALGLAPTDVAADPPAAATALQGADGGLRWHRRKDGTVFPVELHAGAFSWRGRRILASVVHDVSERRRLEAQLVQADRLAAVGTLAAGVAHEINNPLACVHANLEFVATHVQAGEVRTAVEDALVGTQRIRSIVADMQTLSRIDAEQEARSDVADVLEVSLRLLADELHGKARLRRDFAPVPPVAASASRLGQIFVNLLSNAIQAFPQRAAEENEILVRLRHTGDHVTIEIHDNGVGMSPEVLRRIFDPFFTTKPVGVGTGLGLPICAALVRSFGGSLDMSSEPGSGSVFRVGVPAAEGGAVEELRPPAKPRLLVVDDEPMLLTLAARLLRDRVEVVGVGSADEALALVREGRAFDAALIDVMLPGISGIDLYAELEKTAPNLAARAGFMTGGTFTERARHFLETHPEQVLEKPFGSAALVGFVRALLEKR